MKTPPKLTVSRAFVVAAQKVFDLRVELHGEHYSDELDDKLHGLEMAFYKMADAYDKGRR